jgi:uncharacterized protein (TIRG00374 family)
MPVHPAATDELGGPALTRRHRGAHSAPFIPQRPPVNIQSHGKWVVVQVLVTLVLLTIVMRTLDLAALGALFVRLPASFYLLSLAVVLAGQIAYAWRWNLLLRAAGVSVPFAAVLRQYFVAIFVNNFLPSTVGGDAAKVVYLGQRVGYRPVAASVAIDRLLGVGLQAMLAVTALWFSPVSSSHLVAAMAASAFIAGVAIFLLLLTMFGTGGLAGRVARFGEPAVRVAERLQRLRLDMAAPLRRPAVVAQAAIIVVAYTSAVTAIYVQFVSVQQALVPPYLAMLAAVTATTVLSNIPISLNGLGLREQLHISLLTPLGIVAENAVAISLLLYAHLMVASAIGLVFWLQKPAAVGETSGAR